MHGVSFNKSAGDFGFHGRRVFLISDNRKQIISFSTLKGVVAGFAVIPFLPRVVNRTCKASRGDCSCLPPSFVAHDRGQSWRNLWPSCTKLGSFRQCFCIP